VLLAVAALTAQRQFGVLAQGVEKRIDGLRFAGSGKGCLTAITLTDPNRLDATQATRTHRMNRRHIRTTAVTDEFIRPRCLDLCLGLGDAIRLIAPLFCLSHRLPPIREKAVRIAGALPAVDYRRNTTGQLWHTHSPNRHRRATSHFACLPRP
jgi:hypothetical protein